MLKDKYKGVARGVISIYTIDNAKKTKLLTSSNMILPNAALLVAKYLSGDAAAAITNIRVYDGAVLLFNGTINDKAYDAGNNSVIYSIVFGNTSFAGNLDNAQLGPSDMLTLGNFAIASFNPVSKDLTEQLMITWEIIYDLIAP